MKKYLFTLMTVLAMLAILVPASPVLAAPVPLISLDYVFDFDTGSPAVPTGRSTPFDQTFDGVTAHFSSPSDPAAFSIQNHDTTFLTLPQFSNNYLYQNNLVKTSLQIRFSKEITAITLSFATTDSHGVGEVEEPTAIKLTAYSNTIETTPVGSVTARGVFPEGYTYPQSTLSFDSGASLFNTVVVELLYQPRGSTSFLIDDIAVTTLNKR